MCMKTAIGEERAKDDEDKEAPAAEAADTNFVAEKESTEGKDDEDGTKDDNDDEADEEKKKSEIAEPDDTTDAVAETKEGEADSNAGEKEETPQAVDTNVSDEAKEEPEEDTTAKAGTKEGNTAEEDEAVTETANPDNPKEDEGTAPKEAAKNQDDIGNEKQKTDQTQDAIDCKPTGCRLASFGFLAMAFVFGAKSRSNDIFILVQPVPNTWHTFEASILYIDQSNSFFTQQQQQQQGMNH